MDGDFVVQRIWSTSNAAAGKNPRLPTPGGRGVLQRGAVVGGAGQLDRRRQQRRSRSTAFLRRADRRLDDEREDSTRATRFDLPPLRDCRLAQRRPDGPRIDVNNGSRCRSPSCWSPTWSTSDYGEDRRRHHLGQRHLEHRYQGALLAVHRGHAGRGVERGHRGETAHLPARVIRAGTITDYFLRR